MTLELALIQHDIVWEDAERTIAAVRPLVLDAAEQGANLISLTEMWSSGFSMNTERVAEPSDGPTASAMHTLAAETGAWIAGTFPERQRDGSRPTNRFLLAGPQGQDHRYSKTKPFSFANEDQHYASGQPIEPVTVHGIRISPFICYDLRFADLFWNAAIETDLFLIPANWPATRYHHWRSLLLARAIENQTFVAGVNRVGTGGGLDYRGDTMIIDPLGEVLAQGAPGETATVRATINAETVAAVRLQFPFLNDR
jgi:predicted amidohydrolase